MTDGPATGAQAVAHTLRVARRRGRVRPPRGAQPRAVARVPRGRHPDRRLPPRAGHGLRGRRPRPGDRRARRRAHDHRPGRGEHRRRGRRGVGVALPRRRDRDRHPDHAASARRLPRRAPREHRPGRDVRRGHEVDDRRRRRRRDRRGDRHRGDHRPIARRPDRSTSASRPTCSTRPSPRRRPARPATGSGIATTSSRCSKRSPHRSARCSGSAAVREGRRRRDRSARDPPRRARRHDVPGARRAPARTIRSSSARHRTSRRSSTSSSDADLAIVIGSDLDAMTTMAWRLPFPDRRVAINVDPTDATKNYSMDAVLAADARIAELVADAIPPRDAVGRRPRRAGRRPCATSCAPHRETAESIEFLEHTGGGAAPPTRWSSPTCASRATGSRGTSGCRRRARSTTPWAGGRSGTRSRPRSARQPRSRATHRPVVSVSGDGGMLFAIGELATVAQEQLPLTAVVVDDGGYGMLRFGHDAGRGSRHRAHHSGLRRGRPRLRHRGPRSSTASARTTGPHSPRP